MTKLPAPLYNALLTGLQMLLALRLPGAPAADTVAATVQVWEIALAHKRQWTGNGRDVRRFQTAFAELAATLRQWPQPADFLAALPQDIPLSAPPLPRNETPSEKRQRLQNHETVRREIAVVLNKSKRFFNNKQKEKP